MRNHDKTLRKCEKCMLDCALSSSPRMGLQLLVQDKKVVLKTSKNLSLTWNQTCDNTCTDSRLVSSNEMTNWSHQQGTLAPSQIPSTQCEQLESDDVEILDDIASHDMAQTISLSSTQVSSKPNGVLCNPFVENFTMARTNSQSPQAASTRNIQGVRCNTSVPNNSGKRVVSLSAAETGTRHQSSSGEQRDCLKAGAGGARGSSIKKMPLKSKLMAVQHPKRLSHSQRRCVQKKSSLTRRDELRCPSGEWTVSSPLAGTTVETFNQPVISNVVGGSKAIELTRMELDSASLWPSENTADMEHQPDFHTVSKGDRGQEEVSLISQDQAGPSTGRSYHQQTSPQDQPGCSMETSKSNHQHHNNSPVPTSLTSTTFPTGGTPMPTATDLPVNLEKQDTDCVFWTCLSEEPTEMNQRKIEEIEGNDDMPVACDMAPLTAEAMTYSEVASKEVRLAHGYDVFIRLSDLFEAERSSKQSWSIFTRRLLDIYFDRMTLAMGRASYRGTNKDHKPLNQTIIGAIGNEDKMSDDAADTDDDDEDVVPSLQELAAASLEDEDDDNEDDEWKPIDKQTKRKKKQKKKESKRQHVDEPEPGPRKAKQLATLEMSKNMGDGSDSDESDDDFNPMDGALQDQEEDEESESEEDLLVWEEDSDEDDSEDDSEDEDALYDEKDSDYHEDSEEEEEDAEVVVRSFRNKQDIKQQLGEKSPRVLRAREVQSPQVSPAKSPNEATTAENKENRAGLQRLSKDASTPKTEKPKGNKTPGSKTPGGKTSDKSVEKASAAKGQAAKSKTPSNEMGSRTPGRKRSDGSTDKGSTPTAKTPRSSRGGQADQEGKNSKENQTPKSLKKDKKKDQQASKTPKKVKLPGGTVIEDLVAGDGKIAKPGKMVHVYYKGNLASNGKQFDSCLTGKPFMFRLGRSEVIKGWDVGVAGMKVGGERRITVPAAEGYGRKAVGPIPPNSTLVFNVTLKNVS